MSRFIPSHRHRAEPALRSRVRLQLRARPGDRRDRPGVGLAYRRRAERRVYYVPEHQRRRPLRGVRSRAKNLVADDSNRKADIFLYDRQTATTTLVNRNPAGDQADGHSNSGVVSQDGRYVIYQSNARNLVPGHRGGSWDVFRTDLTTGDHDPGQPQAQRKAPTGRVHTHRPERRRPDRHLSILAPTTSRQATTTTPGTSSRSMPRPARPRW